MVDAPPPAPPAAEPWPAVVPPTDPPPAGALGRLAVALAGLALLAYLVAGVLLALPVETPHVQDCGAPGAYLLDGRVDVLPDREDRILRDGEVVTLDADVADAARERRCRDRVAARAVPAAILLAVATLVGLVAFGLELFVVRPRQRRAIRAAAAGPPSTPQGAPPGDDGGFSDS